MKIEGQDFILEIDPGGGSGGKKHFDTIRRIVKKPEVRRSIQWGTISAVILLLLGSYFLVNEVKKTVEPAEVHAQSYQFSPTSTNLVAGTENAFSAVVAASAEGVNIGPRGMKADDNLHWMPSSTAGGLIDAQVNFDGAQLNGANKLIVQTAIDVDAAMNLQVQICDWVSATSVDNAADGTYCTGGGWRTLNTKTNAQASVNLFTAASTNDVALQWHIYDGYWSTGTTGGTAVSTPLTNFVDSANKRVKLRVFNASGTAASPVAIDYFRVEALVDSVYSPAGFGLVSGGTVTGTQYGSANVIGNAATGQQATTTADAVYQTVPGTAGVAASYYYSFKNVRTLSDMNAIYVKADYSCAATGVNIRPQIYNFNTSSWVDLTTANIACATADATNAWAITGINMAHYVQNGEVRAGFRQLTASATANPRNDFFYIMVGSVNADSAKCEVTFGTGTATNCTGTRDLDGTGTTTTFANPAADESATMATSFNALDNDQDTVVEEATASNVTMPVTMPTNSAIVGVNYAARYSGASVVGATALTVQPGLRDYSGLTATTGGWTQFGGTSAAATYVYSDTITAMANTAYGFQTNPEDYIDTVDNEANIRLKTTASGTSTSNATTNWDFAFVAPQWIEIPTVTLSSAGTQTASMNIPSTNQDVGGKFALSRNEGTANVTGLTISEAGTVDGSTQIGNVKLFYDLDTTAPYDCASESYGGAENQFGSTDANGFSAANGTAAFTGSVAVSPVQSMCVYTILDVLSGATNGSTLDIQITAPQTDVVISNGTVTPGTTVTIAGSASLAASGNANPNAPTTLTQGTTSGGSQIAESSWTTDNTPFLGFAITDPDGGNTVKYEVQLDGTSNAFSNLILDYTHGSTSASGTTFPFNVGSYGSGSCAGTCPATLSDSASGYWWRVRAIDNSNAMSGWTEFGGTGSAVDYKVDATAPTGGTIYDGNDGSQHNYNDYVTGSLTQLSAYWTASAPNFNVSGAPATNIYQYAIGTTAGASDTLTWTYTGATGTQTYANATGLNLRTGQKYYFTVRAYDALGSIATLSSTGQMVYPTLSYSLSTNAINFANLNNGNSWTDSKDVTCTVSTNANGGYSVFGWIDDFLRSTADSADTISDFAAGTYTSPSVWSAGTYGFGFTTNDSSLAGGTADRFTNGGPKFAPYQHSALGNVVADHTAAVNGTTGAVSGEQFIITNKVSAASTQTAATYKTNLYLILSANY
jgi:hypothetical protein